MMPMLGWLKKDKENIFAFKQAAAVQQLGNPNDQTIEQEIAEEVGRAAVMFESPVVAEWLQKNPAISSLTPAFQPCIRTTCMTRREATALYCDYRVLFLLTELTMKPSDYEQGALTALKALEIEAATICTDNVEGFKTKAFVSHSRRLDIGMSKKEK